MMLLTTKQAYQEVAFRLQANYLNSLDLLYSVGKGGYGRVWKAELKKKPQIFAVKEMCKVK
jgi:hypothetical protein